MLAGGSRSGKTFEITRGIATRAIKAPKSRHAQFREHQNAAITSLALDTFPKVMQLCYPQVDYEINRQHWYARMSGDSEVWFGGLDDKERTEKVLGREFATLHFNECSQIGYDTRNTAMTRLAQNVKTRVTVDGEAVDGPPLKLRAWYDENPPSKAYWTYKLFVLKRDPATGQPLRNPNDYGIMFLNPRDNLANLPPGYLQSLEDLPARMRKRFLEGQYGDTTEGALWSVEVIDRNRWLEPLPDLQRVIVAVDPSGTKGEETPGQDAVGIVVAGLGVDGRGYVLEDLTANVGPKQWGTIACAAYERHRADLVVAETNYGGEMVRYVLNSVDDRVPVKVVTASRGKVVRAEPISALTEKNKVRFAGHFHDLEDELCAFTTIGYMGDRSPNRADAMIWALSELFPGMAQDRKTDEVDTDTWVPGGIGIGGKR